VPQSDAIDAVASVAPAKAHQVTQLVLTLIGLIVLPRESHYLEAAGDAALPALAAGWPTWTIVEDLSRRPTPGHAGDLSGISVRRSPPARSA
jgi:hypothetical protein